MALFDSPRTISPMLAAHVYLTLHRSRVISMQCRETTDVAGQTSLQSSAN